MINDQYLTDTKWLTDNHDNPNLVIVDCHWDSNVYLRAHIPGAVMRPRHAFIKSENSDGSPQNFFPDSEQFADLMSKIGINNESIVVCYDEWQNHFATRLWWLLRYYGHEEVKLLNGGWQAWVKEDLPISTSTATINSECSFKCNPNPKMLINIDELLENQQNPDLQIIDVRSDDEYNRVASHGNNRVGHIPGAIHLEWNKMLDSVGDEVHILLSSEK